MKRILLLFLNLFFIVHAENITVIGIGRLGLCTALVFEKAGHTVLGVDVNQEYVDKVNNKTLRSSEPQVDEYLQDAQNFRATTDLREALDFSDLYFIIVPTPNGLNEAYDHTNLNNLLEKINTFKVSNKHIVICCTIYPGYIVNNAKNILKNCTAITISYNPEFIAQGSIIQNFENPDVVLIGEGNRHIGDKLEALYKKVTKNNPDIARMSPASAEIAKLALNCFITNKIAYANMVGDIADATPGANKHDILAMVGNDSRVGKKCLMPGYGFGGPCFPRDNRALGGYAKSVNVEPLIPYAVDQANKLHADFMAQQLLEQDLAEYIFEDVNYKPNCKVIILEESQKLAVAEKIAQQEKGVIIRDRKEVIEQVKAAYKDLFEYEIQ